MPAPLNCVRPCVQERTRNHHLLSAHISRAPLPDSINQSNLFASCRTASSKEPNQRPASFVTVYNSETQALFLNSDHPTLDSLAKAMRKNADGSVDIYIGSKAPAGQESNWIYSPAGRGWFPWFRFSLLRSRKSGLRQELDDAGHRES
jgi:hypothetical protein